MTTTPALAAIGSTYRIGPLAAHSGRSVHAIRWYESQGLIPGVTRDDGGRRVYGDKHLGWLDLMDRRLRRTGACRSQRPKLTPTQRREAASAAAKRGGG